MIQPLDQDAHDGVSAQNKADTPSALAPGRSDDALATVEFAGVLEHVAAFAAGPLGAERVRGRRPATDLAWIRAELARVGETALLFRRGEGLVAEPVPDVRRPLGRLRVEGGVLEPREAAAIRRLLGAARLVAQDLRRVAEAAPLAAALLVPLPDRALERRLELAVDDEGQVLDTASPKLGAARREVQAARARLIKRLEELLRRLERDSGGGGSSVTMRGGRYVIPVRRELRQRPSGIIHDESASAGTLFVEPAEAVELGNALREAEVAEERETLRVLRELTELLRPAAAELRAAFEMCVAVDDLVARARYMAACDAEVPTVEAAPTALTIVNGRHPLLLAQGGVVPFALTMHEGERTLLVSGPNTGGKTVLLKATALLSALAQSGIVPPVGAGSQLPAFDGFFADIGDRQSISASLSTFSAHVAILRRVLDDATAGSLVLLDEVGSGTDPAEGAALAGAVLVALTRRGTLTLATTHLGALKSLAAAEHGVVNASLEFDSATLTPTYRFTKGLPGRSYGLAIAKRLGVAADVLADAERRVPSAERELDTLLAEAEARRQVLDASEAALNERIVEADALAARLRVQEESQSAREADLRRREKDADRQGREQARRYLLEARERVEAALGAARQAADQTAARDARRIVEEGIQSDTAQSDEPHDDADRSPVREPGATPSGSTTADPLAVGQRVRVRGTTGEIAEVRSDGRLSVVMGAMRMVVDPSDATPIAGEKPSRRESAARSAGADMEAPAAAFEIDLRGMTGDEAEAVALAAIDSAVLAEHPYLRIIHGKGTGVVRERVRRLAARDRRVSRFDFAPAPQGGTGVTILEFGA